MKQAYVKCFLVYGLISANPVFTFNYVASAQHRPVKYSEPDKTDLLNNIRTVETDKQKIAAINQKIDEAQTADNKPALKIHKKRLAAAKATLKKDFQKMKSDENTFVEIKNKKIATLKEDVALGKARYEELRKRIKKDLADRKDWSLQKDANELIVAQQLLKEKETQLSMEASDLNTTLAATRNEWKKTKEDLQDTADAEEHKDAPKNLSAK